MKILPDNHSMNEDRKFFPDGRMREYLGNSIVSMLDPQSPIFRMAVWAQANLKSLPFSDGLVFLAPSSFHMTVLDLICDQDRCNAHWTNLFPLDTPLLDIETTFQENLKEIDLSLSVSMVFEEVYWNSAIGLGLRPSDQANQNKLRAFRNKIGMALGVRRPNHENYRFHITLAYPLIEEKGHHRESWKRKTASIEAHLDSDLETILFSKAELRFFSDMDHFFLDPRRNLASQICV